jgi:hypothetical protein
MFSPFQCCLDWAGGLRPAPAAAQALLFDVQER